MQRENEVGWVEARIEEYVGQVVERLQEFPEERRQATTHELSEHLRAMISARRSAGLGQAQAWVESVEAFGSAREVGEALAQEWKRAPRIEVRGEPLTAAEKRRVWARPLVVALVVYPLMLWLLPWLSATGLSNIVMPVAAFGSMAFGMWRWRRGGGRWTPSTVFLYVIIFLQLSLVTGSMVWRSSPVHALPGRSPLDGIENVMLPVLMLAMGLGLWWHKRERGRVRPWQHTPRYGQSPVAAEEEYRMGTPIGLAMGTAMGCVGTLWMGWQFFGMGAALMTCGGLIALAVLAARLLK